MDHFYCRQFGPTPSRSLTASKRERLHLQIWNLEPFFCNKSEGTCLYSSWMAGGNGTIPHSNSIAISLQLQSTFLCLQRTPRNVWIDLPTTYNPPSFEYPPLTSSTNDNENNVATSTEDSPRSIEIMSKKQDEEEENAPSEDSMISFYTADTHEPGSQQNPIDTDRFFIWLDTPHPAINVLQRTRSNLIDDRRATHPTNNSELSLPLAYCRICGLHGHLPDGCLRRGPFICMYCREIGHETTNCVKLRRNEARYHPELQFCLVFSQPGHSLDRCFALLHPSQ